MAQLFYLTVENLDTGETRMQAVRADDPEAAMSKVARRKWFVQFILSEYRFRFTLSDRAER